MTAKNPLHRLLSIGLPAVRLRVSLHSTFADDPVGGPGTNEGSGKKGRESFRMKG
jgi:hypothetical protein